MTIQEIIDQRKAEQATRQAESNNNSTDESTDDDDDISVDEVDITTLKVAAGSGK
nr:MAG TPA: hypothetical protein [Caudoviricetes sp.]